ncbi:MAG: 2OG-Fe(II) oxygenase family protein [Nanoarchaeota archaeon]
MKSEIPSSLLDRQKIKEMSKIFISAKPFPHLIIKDFLNKEKAKQLFVALKKEPFQKKNSDLFSLSQTLDFASTKNISLQELYKLFTSSEFTKIFSKITNINLKGKIDMAGSLYEDTDFLLCHDDQLQGRKIAYIYYLSQDFREYDGGALFLLSDKNGHPDKTIKRYLPEWNSCILFEVSKKSWHEVEEVISQKKRYAIGGWLY